VRAGVALATRVGSVVLPNPVMTASGTAGYGAELGAYVDLADLGAVVVKSLAAGPWAGNLPPRVHETPAGMLNAVGLQGQGVARWLGEELPALHERGARVVASIWGRRVEEFALAAELLRGAPGVVAVEVNVSCPNIEDRSRMFAHSPAATAEAVAAAAACGFPLWVKLSPNTADLLEVASAGLDAGAEALVLVNTVLGMAIDVTRRTYRLGSGPAGGGLSGPAIRPVAVRAVHDCRAAFPHAGIVGVGGISRGVDAVEMMMAGADAVEVGTATFRDPRAPARVLRGLVRWCRFSRVADVRQLVGVVHRTDAVAATDPAAAHAPRHGAGFDPATPSHVPRHAVAPVAAAPVAAGPAAAPVAPAPVAPPPPSPPPPSAPGTAGPPVVAAAPPPPQGPSSAPIERPRAPERIPPVPDPGAGGIGAGGGGG